MFRRDAEFFAEGAASANRLKWRWGQRRAKGKGRQGISTVGNQPARFKLTEPLDHCGRRVFSKLEGRFRVQGEWTTYDFRLYMC